MKEAIDQGTRSVNWKVEGMTCSNCALSVSKFLEKKGLSNVKVNPIDGDVHFDVSASRPELLTELSNGISGLGYKVVDQFSAGAAEPVSAPRMNRFLKYVLICLPFTLALLLHMLPALHHTWLMNPWVQLVLCLPVYIIGMMYFGKSAWNSLKSGTPNMNVLITLGATAAFVYSLFGTIVFQSTDYLFYETAATIITLVFLGNYLEEASILRTQKALHELVKQQQVMANMIAYDDQHQELLFPIENKYLKSGDLILIKSGEQVPADAKILSGEASVDESIITGESMPQIKKPKDNLIGGSLITDGLVRAQVTNASGQSVLSNIIDLVKKAQGDKPPAQKLADKISAVFVPVVLGIALVTFVLSWYTLRLQTTTAFQEALMRSIAVLVIACPCAMGLATPAAIAVGLGRGARQGILFRNAKALESFKAIRQVVFDKTGTLTTGQFHITNLFASGVSVEELKKIVYSLEKFSNHPIAKTIVREWRTSDTLRWAKVEERKGLGMFGITKDGKSYSAGSYASVVELTQDDQHAVYVCENDQLIGWLDVEDEIRPEAAAVVDYLHSKKIATFVLSGDRSAKVEKLAATLGIQQVYAEQSPEHKLQVIERLTASAPTAMVGDGINDAPALAKASVGISLSEASQIAVQTADVVLMNKGLAALPEALGLGKHTFLTIKQNLFWAFAYNIVAIPVAAFGFLTPAFGALVMALSDVVLGANSVRLFVKKLT